MQYSKTPLVLYFGLTAINLYSSEKKQVVSWSLPPSIFSNLEIIDAIGFRKLLTQAIEVLNSKPTQVIAILSDQILFSLVLPIGSEKQVDRTSMLAKFRSQVPFPSPFVKEITKERQTLAVAMSRDVYDLLIDQFKALDFEVSTLVPSQLLPFKMPPTGMTVVEAQTIIQHWPRLEAQDFLEAESKKTQLLSSSTAQTVEDKRRTMLLISVFGVLLLILVFVGLFMIDQSKKEQQEFQRAQEEAIAALAKSVSSTKRDVKEETQPVVVEPTDEQSPVATSSVVENIGEPTLGTLSVVVHQPNTSSISSAEIEQILDDLGAQQVELIKKFDVSSTTLVISTGERVTAAQRAKLRQAFEKLDAQVSVRRANDMDSDVLVVLPI